MACNVILNRMCDVWCCPYAHKASNRCYICNSNCEPNYPVPAIQVQVEIKPTYVMIWPKHDEWPYYPAAKY